MHVFVYGTLTDPERVDAVVDSYVFVGAAVCEGLHAVDGTYPTLAPGGEVAGRLLRTDSVDALDDYEGDSYVRVSLPYRGSGPDAAAVYVGDPDALGAAADWPGAGPFEARVRRYVEREDVSVRPVDVGRTGRGG